MSHNPHCLVTATELWLEWAADHGVQCDDGEKSFDELARDYYQASESYGQLASAEQGERTPTASRRMEANVAYARALPIEAALVARGGVLNPYVNPIEVVDPRWGVPWSPVSDTDLMESTPPLAAAPDPLPQPDGDPTGTRGWRP